MTADEMFRKLGYEKIIEDKLTIVYQYIYNLSAGDPPAEYKIYIKFPGGKYYRNALVNKTISSINYYYDAELNYAEILACAQLIREMEAE